MTERLYEQDAYLRETEAEVLSVTDEVVVLDRTVFYARGGGQPGDRGELQLPSGALVEVIDTVKGQGDQILHLLAADAGALPASGDRVQARIDWPLPADGGSDHPAL